VYKYGFPKRAFALTVLILKQVALALPAAEHFTTARDFESLANSFPGFGDACVFGHRGAKLTRNGQIRKEFVQKSGAFFPIDNEKARPGPRFLWKS